MVFRSNLNNVILAARNSSGGIYFTTGATNSAKMTILSTGNIGIGNVNPVAKLTLGPQLAGTAASTTLSVNAGSFSNTLGTGINLASLGFSDSSNSMSFGIHAYRNTTGPGYPTTAIGLGMDVDSSVRAGASLWLGGSGNIGIGTNLPNAKLDVSGHIANSGATATVTSCGTTPGILGNDMKGHITLGSGSPTSCTVTFAQAYNVAPECVITPLGGNPGAIQWWIVPTTTGLVINFPASPTANQQFSYHCFQ